MFERNQFWILSYRDIDFDDLFLIACYYDGIHLKEISVLIGTDRSCLLRRIRKINRKIGVFKKVYDPMENHRGCNWGRWVLNERGWQIGALCKEFIEKFSEVIP